METAIVPGSISETLIGFQTYRNKSDVAVLNAMTESAQARIGHFPHFAILGGYTSKLSLISVASQPQTVRITAGSLESGGNMVNPASVTVERTIPPYGRSEDSAENLFSLAGSSLTTGFTQ